MKYTKKIKTYFFSYKQLKRFRNQLMLDRVDVGTAKKSSKAFTVKVKK